MGRGSKETIFKGITNGLILYPSFYYDGAILKPQFITYKCILFLSCNIMQCFALPTAVLRRWLDHITES